MTVFTDLPNELIKQVIDNVFSDDFDRLQLVSRRIFELSLPCLEEHLILKHTYNHIRFPVLEAKPPPQHPRLIDFVIDVLANPHAAAYVKSIALSPWVPGWKPARGDAKPSDRLMKLVRKFALNRMMLSSDEVNGCVTSIEAGSNDPILAMLLHLLPNLSRISVAPGDTHRYVDQVLNWIIAHPSYGTLRKLKEVTMHYMHSQDQNTFGSVRLFALLPSVQSINIIGGPEKPFALDTPQIGDTQISNVTNVRIRCQMNLASTLYLLKPLVSLRNLSITYLNRGDNATHRPFAISQILNPYSLISNLRQVQSLETLAIYSDDPSPTTTPMANFSRFHILKDISVDSRVLFASAFPIFIPWLADVLPKSLESLEVCIYHQPDLKRDDVVKILEQLLEVKRSHATGLRSVKIATDGRLLSNVVPDSLRKLYEIQGIELEDCYRTKRWASGKALDLSIQPSS